MLNISKHVISNYIVFGAFLSLVVFSNAPVGGQENLKPQSSPVAVARGSFEALKNQDIPAFVALFHPDEHKRFKAFASDVFAFDDPDGQVRQIRELLAPYDSSESVASADGSELLAAFLKNSFAQVPGFEEIFKNAELEVLGEIEEKLDTVHVITRTVMPRPSPISCRKSEGRWYQLLNVETMRMITAFERTQHFRDKALSIETLSTSIKMDKIDVLGHVNDGEDLAHALCRTEMKMEDFSFSVFACYPVRKGEPAWELLNADDKTELVDALREKWGM
ncbi:hypothetical protein [Roseimaritima ulvae]|uniref:hypothetical protein n=1 Tax=Roseimaritima ulvae TaxID=980254 RepID=UPI0012FCE36B|nr:hypothetical protein [Roseimaritima ulvae]